MEKIKITGKTLSKDEQMQFRGGDGANEYCFTLQGSFGPCKTDARCNLDLPLCEPV
jgi:hypothetical protein